MMFDISHPTPVYLNALGIVAAVGGSTQLIKENLISCNTNGMHLIQSPVNGQSFFAGSVKQKLPKIPTALTKFDCRNNQLVLAAIKQVEEQIVVLKNSFSDKRIGVVMATSTSGIAEAEQVLKSNRAAGLVDSNYHYKKQESGSIAEFVSSYLALKGPSYTISTACSSGGKVFASARGLIELDLCDAVIVGGSDSLCELTLSGFDSLAATSDKLTNPFSVNRCGINIGEGAAVFIMTKQASGVELIGVGESSDAHHMSAPEPSGEGAIKAMQAAMSEANIKPEQVDYINLHGTGTQLNDAMESHAVYKIFAGKTKASSTKPFTGHALGAAGAIEAGICWIMLQEEQNPFIAPHVFDGQMDPQLSPIELYQASTDSSHNNQTQTQTINITMSNSFAFGGNNVSVLLRRIKDE